MPALEVVECVLEFHLGEDCWGKRACFPLYSDFPVIRARNNPGKNDPALLDLSGRQRGALGIGTMNRRRAVFTRTSNLPLPGRPKRSWNR